MHGMAHLHSGGSANQRQVDTSRSIDVGANGSRARPSGHYSNCDHGQDHRRGNAPSKWCDKSQLDLHADSLLINVHSLARLINCAAIDLWTGSIESSHSNRLYCSPVEESMQTCTIQVDNGNDWTSQSVPHRLMDILANHSPTSRFD